MNRNGVTLLELLIVVIIIGIFATLGISQYLTVVEKGRTAEAKEGLMQIRTMRNNYLLDVDASAYSLQWDELSDKIEKAGDASFKEKLPSTCNSDHSYYQYSVSPTEATATRCKSGGKAPNYRKNYTITLNFTDGAWNGTPGYY